jgi:Tol biopolymer transport system component
MTRLAVRMLLLIFPALLLAIPGALVAAERVALDVLLFQRFEGRSMKTLMLDLPHMLLVPSPQYYVLSASPSPSPDGRWLVFTDYNYTTQNADIFLRGNGTQLRLVGHPLDDHSPAWSPEGRRMAFTSNREGNYEIYLLDIYEDGSPGELRRLTDDHHADLSPVWMQ